MIFGVAANFLYINSRQDVEAGDTRFLVSLEALRDDPNSVRLHPTHRQLNRTVRDGTKVLFVGDAQAFDLEIPVLYNTCFDESHFDRLFKGKTAAQRLDALHARIFLTSTFPGTKCDDIAAQEITASAITLPRNSSMKNSFVNKGCWSRFPPKTNRRVRSCLPS